MVSLLEFLVDLLELPLRLFVSGVGPCLELCSLLLELLFLLGLILLTHCHVIASSTDDAVACESRSPYIVFSGILG